jgi:hypothetical protein
MGDSQRVETVIGDRGKPVNALVAASALAAIVAADYSAFRLFDGNYFQWYIAQGPLIALAVAGVSVAVELDQIAPLIAAHPAKYAAAWLEVPGLTFIYFSELVRGDGDGNSAPIDSLITALIGFVLMALWTWWLIVIAPLQYFVTLVTGAPARRALASQTRTSIERRGDTTVIAIAPIGQMPEGAHEIGWSRRPVSVTSTMTAALLFTISQFV